jgi:PAS domain S-box-containing protein
MYPLVGSWPTQSRTAEILLVRSDGNGVLFLNEPRHRAGGEPVFRMPLSERDLTARMVARGMEGIVEGPDYREAPVLAAIKKVPDTPWFLITKVDTEEIYAPIRERAWFTAILVSLLILVAGAVVGLLWRHQRACFYRKLYEEERLQNSLAERIEYLTRYANDIILLYDQNLKIIEANERALEAYGYSREAITRIGLEDLRCGEVLPDLVEQMRRIRQHGGMLYESLHCRRDGSTFPVESSVRFVEIDGRPFYQAIIRDITERKRAEQRIDRLTRLYEALSLAGNAIIRSTSRDELFANICRIAVEKGGFSMAWVGLVDSASHFVLPAVFHGCDKSYLEHVIISIDDIPEGRGPTGSAIREKRHVLCPNIAEDPMMRPWRERALSLGYRSSAAFPLIVRGEGVGALMVYAPQADFFDEEITVLLDALTADLSSALESMERDASLEKSRERLGLALRSCSMGVWEWDVVENRNLWDESMYALLGLEPGTPPGKVEDFMALVHPGDRERVSREMTGTLVEGGDFESRFRILRPDGSTRFIGVQGKVYRDDRDNPLRLAGVCWDITDRRLEALKLQQQKELLQTMVDAIPVMICYFDSDGSFKWANKGWEGMLGWSFTGQDVSDILDMCYPDAELRRQVRDFIAAAEGTWRDFKTRAHDDTIIDIAWAAVRLSDETVIAIGQDITEWKRVEEEIRRLNAELEERVRDRTSRLEEANRELEAFSYSVSHDLRTPLRAIRGFSRMLQDERAASLDEEGRRLLGVVIANTEKMGQLIDDLLSFSRVGRNEITRSRIDMSGVVRGVIAELEPLEEGAGIEFVVESLPDAQGDAAMIRQVWVNLIANAVKFTLPKGSGLIRVGADRSEGENVYHVKDTGVGFKAEYAEKAFGIFQRLHSESEFEGTGVGLAIVERIIVRHGGRVWAEGKAGEGAEFYFSLPRYEDVL